MANLYQMSKSSFSGFARRDRHESNASSNNTGSLLGPRRNSSSEMDDDQNAAGTVVSELTLEHALRPPAANQDDGPPAAAASTSMYASRRSLMINRGGAGSSVDARSNNSGGPPIATVAASPAGTGTWLPYDSESDDDAVPVWLPGDTTDEDSLVTDALRAGERAGLASVSETGSRKRGSVIAKSQDSFVDLSDSSVDTFPSMQYSVSGSVQEQIRRQQQAARARQAEQEEQDAFAKERMNLAAEAERAKFSFFGRSLRRQQHSQRVLERSRELSMAADSTDVPSAPPTDHLAAPDSRVESSSNMNATSASAAAAVSTSAALSSDDGAVTTMQSREAALNGGPLMYTNGDLSQTDTSINAEVVVIGTATRVEDEEDEFESSRHSTRKDFSINIWYLIGAAFIVLLSIVLVVVVVFVTGRGDSGMNISNGDDGAGNGEGGGGTVLPGGQSTPAPTPASNREELKNQVIEALIDLSFDEGLALETAGTPQNSALDWLLENPNLSEIEEHEALTLYVLATVYYATGGDDWNSTDGWLDYSTHFCDWYQSLDRFEEPCEEEEELNRLILNENNLLGTIPAEIAHLESLFDIQMNNNGLFGTIPTEIFALELGRLDLYSNQLGPTLPTEIGQVATLAYLDLEVNFFGGTIPSEIGNIEDLSLLWLSSNPFTGTVPTELGNCLEAEALYFYDLENIEGSIPSELCQLRTTGTLSVLEAGCDGQLTCECCTDECPGPPTASPAPTTSSAPTYSIDGIAAFLVERSLDGGTALNTTGSPQSRALTWLLNSPELLQYPETRLLQRYVLSTLYYSTTGENWFDNTGWLSYIVHECDWYFEFFFHGSAACDEDGILREIDLTKNYLDGTIPPELAMLAENLIIIGIANNPLNGTIPTELGLLTELRFLVLEESGLHGTLPSELGAATRLVELALNDIPELTGTIPGEFVDLNDITYLNLERTGVTGVIMDEMCEFGDILNPVDINVDCDNVSCDCCDCEDNAPSPTSTLAPTPLSTNTPLPPTDPDGAVLRLLNERSFDAGVALDNPASPQRAAYLWLVGDPLIDDYAEARLVQRYALATTYFALGGENWNRMENWLSYDVNECLWETTFDPETLCDGTLVNAILLHNNDLVGTLPKEIFLLSNSLERIAVFANGIYGTLPTEIGLVTKLWQLELDNNEFTGSLPTELASLTALVAGYFNGNEFTGAIPGFNSPWLNLLYFSDNNFDGGVPDSICDSLDIEVSVDCGKVECQCCDPECGEFDQQKFEEFRTFFSSLSTDGGAALNTDGTPQYEALMWLASDPISQKPEELQTVIIERYALATFFYAMNGTGWDYSGGWLTSEDVCEWDFIIKDCESEESAIQEIEIVSNLAGGILPQEILLLTNLEILVLSENELGTLPEFIGDFSTLVELWVEGANLSGPLPMFLTRLSNLEVLAIGNNEFTGEITASYLLSFPNLFSLRLGWNLLEGTIPTELGELLALEDLSLEYNELDGPIPLELFQLTSLGELNLDGNRFSGEIATEFGFLRNLSSLELGGGATFNMTGTLPSELGFLENMSNLLIGRTEIEGTIPTEIFGLTNLVRLEISDCFVDGPIPTEVGDLSNLEGLQLYSTNIGGQLPSELGLLSGLLEINLFATNVSGSIPTQLEALTNLEQIFIHSTETVGPLPNSFCALPPVDFWSDCSDHVGGCDCCTYCCTVEGCEEV